MGGGKTKKPISVMDKEARKKSKELTKKPTKEEKAVKKTSVELELSEQLIKRATKVVSESKIVTPSSLASSLGIKVSLARAIIKELIKSEKASLISKHRGFLLAKAP